MNARQTSEYMQVLGIKAYARGVLVPKADEGFIHLLEVTRPTERDNMHALDLVPIWQRGFDLARKYGVVWALGHAHRATDQDGNNKSIFYKQETHGVKVGQVEQGQWSGWKESHMTYVPGTAVPI